jgi:hypothetical protein
MTTRFPKIYRTLRVGAGVTLAGIGFSLLCTGFAPLGGFTLALGLAAVADTVGPNR